MEIPADDEAEDETTMPRKSIRSALFRSKPCWGDGVGVTTARFTSLTTVCIVAKRNQRIAAMKIMAQNTSIVSIWDFKNVFMVKKII